MEIELKDGYFIKNVALHNKFNSSFLEIVIIFQKYYSDFKYVNKIEFDNLDNAIEQYKNLYEKYLNKKEVKENEQ